MILYLIMRYYTNWESEVVAAADYVQVLNYYLVLYYKSLFSECGYLE